MDFWLFKVVLLLLLLLDFGTSSHINITPRASISNPFDLLKCELIALTLLVTEHLSLFFILHLYLLFFLFVTTAIKCACPYTKFSFLLAVLCLMWLWIDETSSDFHFNKVMEKKMNRLINNKNDPNLFTALPWTFRHLCVHVWNVCVSSCIH